MIDIHSKETQQQNLVQFLQFKNVPELRHAYTTRHGGVSHGFFSSMNLGFNRGDDNELVQQNYSILANALKLNKEDFVLSKQVHGDCIIQVTSADRGNGLIYPQKFDGVDGFITNEKQLPLILFFADCVPLFFYDPVNHCIGLCHAGWKGTVQQIGPKTIEAMGTAFGSKPENILVGIGPSIGPCCYEVSEDVKKEFDLSFNDVIIASVIQPHNDKYLIDLWKANEMSLLSCGVLTEHIEISGLCTQCHSSTFFSHRVMGVQRGSQVGVMSLV